MLLCTLAVSAHDFEVGGIYYNITSEEDLTVVVTFGSNKYSGAVTIPAIVTYEDVDYSVTSIENYTFSDCSLTSIPLLLPENVTDIVSEAFYGCSSLTFITCEVVTPPKCILIYLQLWIRLFLSMCPQVR